MKIFLRFEDQKLKLKIFTFTPFRSIQLINIATYIYAQTKCDPYFFNIRCQTGENLHLLGFTILSKIYEFL